MQVESVSNLKTAGGTSTLDVSPQLQGEGHGDVGSSCSLGLPQIWGPLSPTNSSDYSRVCIQTGLRGACHSEIPDPTLRRCEVTYQRWERGKKRHGGKRQTADSTLFKDPRQWACPSVGGKNPNLKTEGLPFFLEDSVSGAPERWGVSQLTEAPDSLDEGVSGEKQTTANCSLSPELQGSHCYLPKTQLRINWASAGSLPVGVPFPMLTGQWAPSMHRMLYSGITRGTSFTDEDIEPQGLNKSPHLRHPVSEWPGWDSYPVLLWLQIWSSIPGTIILQNSITRQCFLTASLPQAPWRVVLYFLHPLVFLPQENSPPLSFLCLWKPYSWFQTFPCVLSLNFKALIKFPSFS